MPIHVPRRPVAIAASTEMIRVTID
jgi:hypothetical protein